MHTLNAHPGPEIRGVRPILSGPLLACLVAVFTLVAACSDDPATPTPRDAQALEVNVHLLSSSDSEALSTTLDEDEVTRLFGSVNEVWGQADIEWEVQSVVRTEVSGGSAVQDMVEGSGPPDANVLREAVPLEDLTEGVWDVLLIRDLGGMVGGVYFPALEVVIQPELAPDGTRDIEGSLTRILSHELGHGLGLQHVPCTGEGNLMAPGCLRGDRTRLTAEQIEASRAQAEIGPYRGGPASF